MAIQSILEKRYLQIVDLIFARCGRPMPSKGALRQCKIVSHRGEHDNERVKENTLAAFDQAVAAGVWGIEMDVRWTKDLVPVVAHDPDLLRVFGMPDTISASTWSDLHRKVPDIPMLSDVVARYGGRQHMMIEIKRSDWPDPSTQSRTLQEALSPLAAVQDYHLMSLHPQSLSKLSGFPARSLVAIANTWPDRYSQWVRDQQWGGFCTHYSLMRHTLIHRHKKDGQQIGVGYPSSPNSLKRELNRGVDWIFSNNAADLQAMLARMMKGVEHVTGDGPRQ